MTVNIPTMMGFTVIFSKCTFCARCGHGARDLLCACAAAGRVRSGCRQLSRDKNDPNGSRGVLEMVTSRKYRVTAKRKQGVNL